MMRLVLEKKDFWNVSVKYVDFILPLIIGKIRKDFWLYRSIFPYHLSPLTSLSTYPLKLRR